MTGHIKVARSCIYSALIPSLSLLALPNVTVLSMCARTETDVAVGQTNPSTARHVSLVPVDFHHTTQQ